MKAVGARLPRYDGIAHVTGRTQYVDDVRVHGTLWCKALRSPHHTRAHPLDRHEQGRGRMPGVHAIVTHEDVPHNVYGHLEGLGVPADEPLLAVDDVRWKGQPIAAVAAESEEVAQAAVDAIEIEFEEREPILDIRTAADPGAGEHFHQWGPIYPHFGPHNHRRVRKGDIEAAFDAGRPDRRGRLPPAGDRALPAGDAGLARGPRAQRAADDLLLHAGDVLLDGRRRRAPAVAAEQAEVRRRHGRRRLRRQGRHGDRDDLRAAGDQGAPPGQVALHPRGGVPDLLDAGAVAHRDPRRGDERRLDPRPAHADAPRRRRLRALLALRADQARLPPHRRLHDPQPALRRLRALHQPRADDGHARLRRHLGVAGGRDCT